MFDMSTGDLLLALVIFWIAFKVIITMIHRYLTRRLSKMKDFIKRSFISLTIEKHDGMLFVYDAVTSEFVCMGKTLEELGTAFRLRHPTLKGIFIKDGNKGVI